MNKITEITPSMFYKYSKSPHWIWLDLYGDKNQKTDIPELALKLIEEGVLHEEDYVKDLEKVTIDPEIPENIAEQNTLEFMKQGVGRIYQGCISCISDGVKFKGRPDLLEKREGVSKFGDYHYVPVEIKNSTKCDDLNYKKQVMFYAVILNSIQDFKPKCGGFINRNKEYLNCELTDKLLDQTNETIASVLEILSGKEPPLSIKSTTKETPWFDYLLKKAQEANDIALLYKVSDSTLEALRNEKIATLTDMASCDVDTLPKIKGSSIETLRKAKTQAESLVVEKVFKLTDPVLPDAETKIYFDIEGDPLLKVEYMFGFLIARPGKKSEFKYFLAESPDQEKNMWESFMIWLSTEKFQNYKVFHYHSYEKTKLKQLSDKYMSSEDLAIFESNLVDLLKVTTSSFIFPVYFYSIKDIAKHLSFKWQHAKAGGAQSVFWYENWLETNDRSILQDIINYNEDDVRATEFLHHWLMTNKTEKFQS